MQPAASFTKNYAIGINGVNGSVRSPLADLISQYALQDGCVSAPLPGVRFLRTSQPTPAMGTVLIYKPSIILVAQGRKQIYLADQKYTFDAQNYLILSVPLPIHEVRVATPEAPFLSMSLSIDLTELSALILEMDGRPQVQDTMRSGISVSPVSTEIYDAAIRLLQAMLSPVDNKILGPFFKREIIYRALSGPQGGFLRAIALRHGYHYEMARVLNLIHTQFEASLDVPTLAKAANMSISTFHHNFKAVTSLAPLQYVKTVRLHKSRSLMLYEGLSATEAAYRVGYSSVSQFSREFRRLFGLPPREELARLQATGEHIDDEAAMIW